MTPELFLRDFLIPGLDYLTKTVGPVPADTPSARMMGLVIPGVESNWTDRLQGGGGPAHSFFQFERAGGLARILADPRTSAWTRKICDALCIPFDSLTIFQAMIWNDLLAVALMRMNLFLDRAPLPRFGDEEGGYQYYLRVWAPGKPDRARWSARFSVTMMVLAARYAPGPANTNAPPPGAPAA